MSFVLDDVGLTHDNGFVALSGISLTAAQGESIALIGPSGAGKTSLLSTLGTGYLPSSGRLQVLGQSASAQSSARELKALRSRIGSVYQSAPIPLRQRVVTAVLAGKLGQWPLWKALASLAYPQDIPGAADALARVQLQDKLFARCDQLSGGQLQRVGIARVLYQQAELILATSPSPRSTPACRWPPCNCWCKKPLPAGPRWLPACTRWIWPWAALRALSAFARAAWPSICRPPR